MICPVFASGTPPLSLAALQAVLRQDGVPTLPFDLDFLLLREDARTHAALYAAYNIGHADGVDTVQFVIRPAFTLRALFPDAFPPDPTVADDLAVVAAIEARLVWWAEAIAAQGVGAALLSVYVSNLLPSLLLARALHARGVRVAFGGPGVGAEPIQDLVLRLGWVEACAPGEGEAIVTPLARALLGDGALTDVPGVVVRDGDGIRANPPPAMVPIRSLLAPDFAGFPLPGHDVRTYRSNPAGNLRWFGAALPIATTRGCVMRCTFCSESVYWTRWRARDPDAVIDEIEALVARWGVRQFLFGDSLLNGTPAWLDAFVDRVLARGVDVTFLFAYLRPTRLPRERLARMFQAGFRVLGFGLETASQRLLDQLEKGTRADEARQICADALDVGLHVNVSVLCGLPGEEADDLLASVRFVHELRARDPIGALTVHAGGPLRVEPASPMYRDPEAAGIVLLPGEGRLPDALAHLAGPFAALTERWRGSVAPDEIRARAALLADALGREPSTVFVDHAPAWELGPDDVVRAARPLRILSDGDAFVFADDARLVAHTDAVVAAAWPRILRGARVAELGEDGPRIATALLDARLAWVDDLA